MKICLMTDSASDLTHEIAKEYDIRVLPVTITYGGKEHKEFEELDLKEYWDFLETSDEQPKTAQITPVQYVEAFEKAKADGYDEVIFLAINAAGSGTYNSGLIGRDLFYGEHGEDMKIHIVDSKNYSYTYGSALVRARKMIDEGKTSGEIIEMMEDHCSRVEAAATVFTLKNLKKSGRVSGAAAYVGELLGIKPIIHLCASGVNVVEKVRGDKMAVKGLIKFADGRMDKSANQSDCACILCGKTNEEYIKMVEDFLKENGVKDVLRIPLGGSICTNTGPNVVGIVYFGEKRA